MKTIITFFSLVFLILIISNTSISQCYTILSVKGEIVSEKTGQPIKEMDEICATDKLTFSTPDSKAAVLSPEQGRYVIKLNQKKKDALTAFVSSVLFAGKERLSTKIIDFDELELENATFYKSEFGDSYFIIRESKIFVDSKFFPMNEHNYFFVKYLFDGKEIEKKLKFNNEALIINKDIFKYEDFIINPETVDSIEFYYFDREKSKKIKLNTFKLAFADEEKLYAELSNFISILKKADKIDYIITQEVFYFLNDVYGNVNGNDVSAWIEEKFGIK